MHYLFLVPGQDAVVPHVVLSARETERFESRDWRPSRRLPFLWSHRRSPRAGHIRPFPLPSWLYFPSPEAQPALVSRRLSLAGRSRGFVFLAYRSELPSLPPPKGSGAEPMEWLARALRRLLPHERRVPFALSPRLFWRSEPQ